MIIQKTDTYIKACMQAWLFCESCIHEQVTSNSPRPELIRQCHDCAQACFAVVSKLINNASDVQELAFNCVLHCRECQQECKKYSEVEEIYYCGEVCRYCADKVIDIAVPFYLN
jgi:hypothetical protein